MTLDKSLHLNNIEYSEEQIKHLWYFLEIWQKISDIQIICIELEAEKFIASMDLISHIVLLIIQITKRCVHKLKTF